jgi:methylenetetrahydrofolate dehydrogenase (NADP+)/methenyltetrahydrofolate cyclohydrolase
MLIDWKKIAWKIYEEIKNEVENIEKKPVLGAILVWNNSASLRYIKQKRKWADFCWIDFKLKQFEENISEEELLEEINKFNLDENISWYIVQLPLPKNINENKIIRSINSKKDVDWFHPENQWKILIWDNSWFVPCTPAWIIDILKFLKVDFYWKNVVIIGRSNIVWKPIANLLINLGSTVSVCNSKTKNIEFYTKKADIVIVATWKPWLIDESFIKKESIIIDVWFTVIDWKIHWDCLTKQIDDFWAQITPVPGWVWALTVAMLMKNTLKASKINKKI